MKLYIYLICLLVLTSCKPKNPLDNLKYYTVHKKAFINNLTVYGYIESNNMLSYNCPFRGYDLTINYLATEGIVVKKNDTICRLGCAELENQYLDAEKNYELAVSELEKTKAQQELQTKILESQVKSIEASTAISMLDSSRLEFYTPSKRKISELNLEKAKIESAKYRRKLDYTKRINAAVISKLQMRIKQQDNRVKRFSEQIGKLNIVADTTGILQYSRLWSTGVKAKVGDVVWGNSPILSIIDVSSLQVKLLVNETEFKQIQKDQKVEIRIDAGDTSLYTGKITAKSPGGKSFSNNEDSKIKYFEITSTIEPKPRNIQPGVSVTCKVIIDEIKDTLTVPIMTVFEQDSSKIVYLLKKDKCMRKTIKTGAASDKEIIVTEGLKPKDRILLTEPPESLLQ